MTCPMLPYLEQELDRRFKLFRLWNFPQKKEFLRKNSLSIQAVVGNSSVGADADLIDSLPGLEIVANFSVGLDKVDLGKCREKAIRVSNTPDVLTEDVADLAIGLILATLRRICESDRYVRNGLWKKGDFKLTSKVWIFLLLIFVMDLFDFRESPIEKFTTSSFVFFFFQNRNGMTSMTRDLISSSFPRVFVCQTSNDVTVSRIINFGLEWQLQ